MHHLLHFFTYYCLTVFEEACAKEALITHGNNIAFKMGGDFTYSNADMWYRNLDKLIDYMNQQYQQKLSRWNVFYSNPSIYVSAKNEENLAWPVKGPFLVLPTTTSFSQPCLQVLQYVLLEVYFSLISPMS